MTQRLPSLNALRAFEAAARHLSLTKAARELNVTPAAVSHQVKALEADLGVTLLRRVKGEFLLTEAAQSALPVLQAGFDQIAEAARRLRADEARHFLTISVGPTFASTWLVRRLGGFKETFPEIEVRLQTTDRLADFARDGVDAGIRFGGGDYPGSEAIRLFNEEIYPVCSPRLLARGPPLRRPDDLAHHTLLHVEWMPSEGETLDWQMWLRAAGATGVEATRGPRFSHANMALQAAIAGQGLVLGSDSLAKDELAAGRLVRPFDVALPVNFTWYLVYPAEAAERPKIVAFRDWILSEVAAEKGTAGPSSA
jgi:LysR family glycine cleavage system transcriptional activator